jgi:hypothetical protein
MHTGEPVRITSPVCTGTLCDQLSNVQSVIEKQSDRDNLRTTSDVKIVSTALIFKRRVYGRTRL